MFRDTLTRQKYGSIGVSLLLALSVVAGSLALLTAPAAAAGDVTVSVTDSTGSAVDGATVEIYNDSSDALVTSGTTDSGGSVTFGSVSDGDYYAEVSADGYVSTTTSNFTVSGSAVSVDASIQEEPSELVNQTVSVGSDTDAVFGEAEINESLDTVTGTTEVTVTFYGMNETNGTETEVQSDQTTAAEGSTVYNDYALSTSDLDEYDQFRVVIEADADHVDSTDYGSVQQVSGGGGGSGGGIFGMSIMGIPVVALIGGAAVLLYMREN